MAMKRVHKRPLPPRWRWPRGKQTRAVRRKCKGCGQLDRAVSSREQLTYYGPAHCEHCGRKRGLRKVERPIDYRRLKQLYHIPRDMVLPWEALE